MKAILAINGMTMCVLLFSSFLNAQVSTSSLDSNINNIPFTVGKISAFPLGDNTCFATLEDPEWGTWVAVGQSSLRINLNAQTENLSLVYDRSKGVWGDLHMTFNNYPSLDQKGPFYDGETITRKIGGIFSSQIEVEIILNQRKNPNDKNPLHTWTKKLIYKDKCPTPLRTHLTMGFIGRFFYGRFSR